MHSSSCLWLTNQKLISWADFRRFYIPLVDRELFPNKCALVEYHCDITPGKHMFYRPSNFMDQHNGYNLLTVPDFDQDFVFIQSLKGNRKMAYFRCLQNSSESSLCIAEIIFPLFSNLHTDANQNLKPKV